MKLIDTNKDVIFAMIIFIWLYLGIVIAFFTNINVLLFNIIMTSLFAILTLFKIYNKKFNNWLNRKI